MKTKIIEIIAEELGFLKEGVLMGDKLVEDLKMDASDSVELTMHLEDEFGIAIPDDDVEAWITVRDVVEYVENLKK